MGTPLSLSREKLIGGRLPCPFRDSGFVLFI
jgi:hypothetical protein